MTNIENTPILESNRITLREINVQIDAPEWYKLSKDPDIHRWTGNNAPGNILETRENLKKYSELEQIISWAIINNETGKIIGTYWVWKPIEYPDGSVIIPSEAERIAKRCWRKGYMQEARKLIYDYCFNILNVHEVHAQVWKDNVNSIKSLEHAGHVLYKEEEKMIEQFDSYHIECNYMITRATWMNSRLMKNT